MKEDTLHESIYTKFKNGQNQPSVGRGEHVPWGGLLTGRGAPPQETSGGLKMASILICGSYTRVCL